MKKQGRKLYMAAGQESSSYSRISEHGSKRARRSDMLDREVRGRMLDFRVFCLNNVVIRNIIKTVCITTPMTRDAVISLPNSLLRRIINALPMDLNSGR